MCKIVSKLGFVMVHQKGSHTVRKHEDGRTTTIPLHSGKKLPRGLIIMSNCLTKGKVAKNVLLVLVLFILILPIVPQNALAEENKNENNRVG